MNDSRPFWQRKSLDAMNEAEWESLCDGCGRCCLHKVEYVESGDLGITDVACKLLDLHDCRCIDYHHRKAYVPDCVKLDLLKLGRLRWLPKSCAYRRLYEGKDLLWWHPLVSGDLETVHKAGISVRGKAVCETTVKQIERRVQHWVKRI